MQVSMYYNCNASNMLGRELTDVRPPANFVKMFAHFYINKRGILFPVLFSFFKVAFSIIPFNNFNKKTVKFVETITTLTICFKKQI